MKFDAAAITPGRANICQNGTEPSAKSIQSVPLPEIPHVPAAARCGVAAKAAHAASAMTRSLLIDPTESTVAAPGTGEPPGSGLASRPEDTRGSPCGAPRREAPRLPPSRALFVQRRVDLGDLLGLGR